MISQYIPDLPPMQRREALAVRDFVAVGFRHRRALIASFVGVLIAASLVTFLLPRTYEAHLRILVKNGRVDPLVSPDPNVQAPQPRETDLEAALNSEAELLKSRDLLEQVVIATGLDQKLRQRGRDDRMAVALATEQLAHDLRVQPVAKTDIIALSYRSTEPKLAAGVLNTLANLYLQKHVELHRTPGQYTFFTQLAEDYRKQLVDAETKIANSGQVAPGQFIDLTLQKYNDAIATVEQTKAAIHETEKRIAGLQKQSTTTPLRVVTQTHRADNQALLQQMKSTLLTLQLKRSELLAKYQPTYRPVQDIEKEIAETETAIRNEENSPAREQTTDQNPTHTWIDGELAKANADLVSLKARQAASAAIVQGYEARLQSLGRQRIADDDLQRVATTAKENYSLYVRKAEEARISEALDRNKILNVAIAERATEPLLPKFSRIEYLLVGFFVAVIISIGVLLAAHHIDGLRFAAPDDVVQALQLPVLAVIPAHGVQPRLAEAWSRTAN